MNSATPESELKAAVEHLIQSGCNYRLEETREDLLAGLEDRDRRSIRPGDCLGLRTKLPVIQIQADSGASPLDTTARFDHLEVSGQYGYVVVTRHMALADKPQKIVFSLTLNKFGGAWRVLRETAVIVGET